ncbi:Polygalacturonase QRT3 [Linum perenne]
MATAAGNPLFPLFLFIAIVSSTSTAAATYHQQIKSLQDLRSSISSRRQLATAAPSPSISQSPSPAPLAVSVPPPDGGGGSSSLVYHFTAYGADPTGVKDSSDAISKLLADVVKGPTSGTMLDGIKNYGGAQIHLGGGDYVITKPLKFPSAGVGNIVIAGGTLRASDDFPTDGYLIDLSATSSNSYDYEYITFRDLMLDANFRGGGVSIRNAVRVTVDNCYITHFNTDGIIVTGGHEALVRSTFIGQHITAGGDPDERKFSGTGINIKSNDNAITDVVIFSANVGIMISGQANILTGVHCYNKASGFGGTGIYVKIPGLSQTRIVNSYLDFTGIVAEDPVQLTIADSFFLGGAFVVFKSVNGVAKGVNVVNNMFSGSGGDTVRLDGSFKDIDGVVVEGNNAHGGMNVKATAAQRSASGNGTTWTVDFNSVLLFPDRISYAQYSLSSSGTAFPKHALRNVTGNQVVVESDEAVTASVFVAVSQ